MLSQVSEDEKDTEDPAGGAAKSKKKRKKKKKAEEEATSEAQARKKHQAFVFICTSSHQMEVCILLVLVMSFHLFDF